MLHCSFLSYSVVVLYRLAISAIALLLSIFLFHRTAVLGMSGPEFCNISGISLLLSVFQLSVQLNRHSSFTIPCPCDIWLLLALFEEYMFFANSMFRWYTVIIGIIWTINVARFCCCTFTDYLYNLNLPFQCVLAGKAKYLSWFTNILCVIRMVKPFICVDKFLEGPPRRSRPIVFEGVLILGLFVLSVSRYIAHSRCYMLTSCLALIFFPFRSWAFFKRLSSQLHVAFAQESSVPFWQIPCISVHQV